MKAMNLMEAMNSRRLFSLTVLVLLLGSIPASAQAPLEPAQMPPRTVFYLIWRGAPATEVRKANSLLALWDDPDFAPVRSALAAGMFRSSEEKSPQEKLTAEEIQEYSSLLENSFTLGYLSESAKHAAPRSPAPPAAKVPAWNGMFFVYDRTGKEAAVAKAILLTRARQKEAPRISQLTIAGAAVLKAEGKNGATYWAEHGKYVISAGEHSVMEELLGRLGSESPAGTSLAQSAVYQEAQAILGGALEFFVRIPDLKDLAVDSKAGDFQVRSLLDAVKLDAIHSLSGHVALEGARTHLQAAILGDAAPGTPFDIWSSGQASPASLAFVPADAVSYNATELNFQGIYDTLKRIARAAFPQGQQGNADILDALAQARLGMPLTDALGLLSGEFASMQTSPSMDSAKQVYFLGIRKKPEALKLLRTVFSDRLTSERNEGAITFLKVSLGGKQGSAGLAQWHFFNLAVTSDMILGASRIDTLRDVISYRAHPPAAGGLSAVPQFQAGRAKFPENLNGLSYVDFQKLDWQALKNRWVEEAEKNPAAKTAAATKTAAPPKVPGWLSQANPQVFSRHLHYSSSVSWKDSKGIHWDQWLE